MNLVQFQILFPISILICYLSIKLWADNKNDKTTWYETIFCFPIDIIFLGIAYVSGFMVTNLEKALLGVLLIIICLILGFLSKIISNAVITKLYYKNHPLWAWIVTIFHYTFVISLIWFLLKSYS